MSFYGSSFSFDGVSCEEYGLMMYDFGSATQGNSEYAPGPEIMEDRVNLRHRSICYGAAYTKPLEFTLIFGADEESAANGESIDRQEMEVIGSWLTGHNEYKWLVVDDPDMMCARYRCVITDLKTIEVGMRKWAFQCTVHCDSPYAYLMPQEFRYTVNGSTDIVLHNRSSMNTPYSPIVELTLRSGDFYLVNHDDKDSEFAFAGLPIGNSATITIDGERGIITSSAASNPYQYCNFTFPRLVRGDNHLTITGNGEIVFKCEFPVNIGG